MTESAAPAARTLESKYYTDPAIFELEKQTLLASTWQFAGHVSQVAKKGDFFRFEIAGEGLLCVRGRDEEVRTFYNVCQHRAHEVVTKDSGNARLLVCPYHTWAYDLTGQLRNGPNLDSVRGLDKGSICLPQVKTEIVWGFIFVNLDPEAKSMDEWYPGFREGILEYVPHIEQLAPLEFVEVDEASNWKVAVENYSECYHCEANHKTFVDGVVNAKTYNVHQDHYMLQHTSDSKNLDKMSYEIDPDANEHATHYKSWFLWPMTSFQVYPGNVLNTFHWRPLAADRVLLYRGWYTIGGEESEATRQLAKQDRETTVEEDIGLVESVQRGLRSRGYQGGPLVVDPDEGVMSEHPLVALHGWYREGLNV